MFLHGSLVISCSSLPWEWVTTTMTRDAKVLAILQGTLRTAISMMTVEVQYG